MSRKATFHFSKKLNSRNQPLKAEQHEVVQSKAPVFNGYQTTVDAIQLLYANRDKLIVDLDSHVMEKYNTIVRFMSVIAKTKDSVYQSIITIIDDLFGNNIYGHLTVGSIFSKRYHPLDRYPDCSEMCLLRINHDGTKICPYAIGSISSTGVVKIIISTIQENKKRIILFTEKGYTLSESNITYIKSQGFTEAELVYRTATGYNYYTSGFVPLDAINSSNNSLVIGGVIAALVVVLLIIFIIFLLRGKK